MPSITSSPSPVISEKVENAWQEIVNVASEALGTLCVMINRLDPPDLLVLQSNTNRMHDFPTGKRCSLSDLFCSEVADQRRKLLVRNVAADLRWSSSCAAKAGVVAYAGYPLFNVDGTVFGTLCSVNNVETIWDERFDALLHTFKLTIEAHLALLEHQETLASKNSELKSALCEVTELKGLLPICTSCKKIRDDNGYWTKFEAYFSMHSSIEFSHGICPDCAGILYPEYLLYQQPAPVG